MPIGQTLGELLRQDKLIELPSLMCGYDTGRTMIVAPEIYSVVMPPFADTEEGERLAEFRQWLDAFSELSRMSVSENPDVKPEDSMLARVRPVGAEFWSIRVVDPEDTPGIRSLGAFAGKDKFIALTWDYRESIGSGFSDEVNAVRAIWSGLFGTEPPFSGANLDAYLSNAYVV